MFIKLSVILCILKVGCGQNENHEWELAVVLNDQIEMLQSNGTLIGSSVRIFSQLKALAFDNVRHQFVVSDQMDQKNDTIFTVQLTKKTDDNVKPIIQDLPDDIQGLAVDPIEDILYWTDAVNKTINYVNLNDTEYQKQLFSFDNENPQGIAIDVCRRYIYWTNSDVYKPTIERARLDGSDHTVLIDSNLHEPYGITIDYKAQRIYWVDRDSIYCRIHSSNLEGKEREIIYEGTFSIPYGIAVDEFGLYWTDTQNNALWRISKPLSKSAPEKIRRFEQKPMGLVAKNIQIREYPDCKKLEEAIEAYKEKEPVEEYFEEVTNEQEQNIVECLNGGKLSGEFCKCRRGFVGRRCEIETCHNFCLHGDCRPSSNGYPQCHCHPGFGGKRCEIDMCDGFCLNDGRCSYYRGDVVPKCECRGGFIGGRCEVRGDFESLCKVYCRSQTTKDVLVLKDQDMCRCIDGSYEIFKSNQTTAKLTSEAQTSVDIFDRLKDPFFIAQTVLLAICLVVICVLSLFVHNRRKNLRPRIKKRIIVNKNITPLTYRPQPTTEQCEITIENCCNMNVCETPCFEPPNLRGKNEDKKTLLSNMENGEDFY